MSPQKHQLIRTITANKCRFLLLLVFAVATNGNLAAQQTLNEGITLLNGDKHIALEFNLFNLSSNSFGSDFSLIVTPATNGYSHDAEKPMLPLYRRIILLPEASSFSIEIESESWSISTLSQLGSDSPLAPALPPTFKSSETIKYQPDSTAYNTDEFYGSNLIRIDTLGQMRDSRLALLTIAPVRYNPVAGQVAVCNSLSAKIHFDKPLKKRTDNPMLIGLLPDKSRKEYNNQLIANDNPQTYLIVAPSRFQHTLQPLVRWKRQQGYIVEEYYTDFRSLDGIKSHLQHRFDNATPNRPAPLFILLVGDTPDIPIWPGIHRIQGLDPHRTDLYYAEYTGDCLPDALIGRISTSDTTTLQHIIEKSIRYELFDIPDSSYLNRSMLVAGKEETPPAPTVTNGQVNYIKTHIIQHDSQHDTLCFYNPASDTMGNAIQNHLRQGIGFINYTAHCTAHGWRHPMLSNNDIDSLTLGTRPFLSINNCCRSNEVSGDCFGEHLLCKTPGGAIGVIGASNETLWEEDYYWSVGGSGAPSLTPQYSPTMPGAYDRFFHTNGEPYAQQAVTQSQIVLAGNWAVTASGSQYSNFYWEIYNLLGDPSLMPYIGIPAPQQLEIEPITQGDAIIMMHGSPGARVAATINDTLLGICTIGDDGNGLMHTFFPSPDSILITAMAQFHKPLQRSVATAIADAARIVTTSFAMHNTDGESISQLTLYDTAIVTATVRNVGAYTATNHRLNITTSESTNGTQLVFTLASLQPQQDTTVSFVIYPQTRAQQLTINFESSDDSTYWSFHRNIDLLAAEIAIENLTLAHNGQITTTVTPSTIYNIQLDIVNNGNGRAKELTIDINGSSILVGNLDADSTAHITSQITTPEQLDSLTITITVSHRSDTLTQTICFHTDTSGVISIDQPDADKIKISPNPADNIVTFSGFDTPTHIIVYDLYGRIVKEFFVKNNETVQYYTHQLRCGVYSVLFSSSQPGTQPRRKNEKLIIAR